MIWHIPWCRFFLIQLVWKRCILPLQQERKNAYDYNQSLQWSSKTKKKDDRCLFPPSQIWWTRSSLSIPVPQTARRRLRGVTHQRSTISHGRQFCRANVPFQGICPVYLPCRCGWGAGCGKSRPNSGFWKKDFCRRSTSCRCTIVIRLSYITIYNYDKRNTAPSCISGCVPFTGQSDPRDSTDPAVIYDQWHRDRTFSDLFPCFPRYSGIWKNVRMGWESIAGSALPRGLLITPVIGRTGARHSGLPITLQDNTRSLDEWMEACCCVLTRKLTGRKKRYSVIFQICHESVTLKETMRKSAMNRLLLSVDLRSAKHRCWLSALLSVPVFYNEVHKRAESALQKCKENFLNKCNKSFWKSPASVRLYFVAKGVSFSR